METTRRVEIALQRADVHRYVLDPLNDPQWCPKVLRVEAIDAEAGSYVVEHRPIPLRPSRRMEHRRIESSLDRIVWHSEDGADVFDVTYMLEELVPNRTRFTQRSAFELGAPRPLWPLMRLGIGRDLSVQLNRLKSVLESGTSRRSSGKIERDES